jgi:WD40 repeat protein
MANAIAPTKARLFRTVAKDVGFWSAAISPSDKRLFVGGTDFNIHVYDLPEVRLNTAILKGHTSYVTALAYSPTNGTLISGGLDRQLFWWNIAETKPDRRADARARINHIAASADGRLLAVATDDLQTRMWNAATGKLERELTGGHPMTTILGRRNTVYCVALSPDAARLATGDRAGTICVWDTATGKLQYKAAAATFYSQAFSREKLASEYEWGGVRCLAFSRDGKLLVAGGMGPADQNSAGIDGPMRIEAFDAVSGKSMATFMGAPKGMLQTMICHPDGDWFFAAGGGGQAGAAGIGSLWAWKPGQLDKDGRPAPPVIHPSAVVIRELLLNADGKSLLAVGMQRDLTAGRIEIWDLTNSAPLANARKPVPAKK